MTYDVTKTPYAQQMQREGLRPDRTSGTTVTEDGMRYEEITFTDRDVLSGKLGMAKRVGHGAIGVLGLFANFSRDFRRATWDIALNGRVEEKVRYNPKDPLDAERNKPATDGTQRNALVQRLGYDPKDRESIQAYLTRPEIRSQLVQSNGNYMLPEHRRGGTSSFLFVPNGDFDKATSIKISSSKTGEHLKGAEFTKAMHTYSSQYEDMITGMKEKENELAVQLGKKRGFSAEQIETQKEKLKKAVRKHFRVVVLSPQGNHSRIYGHVDPNNRGLFGRTYNYSGTGTRIDWSDGTQKEVGQLWKKGPEDKLTKDRPFEHLPPAPQPPFQDHNESPRSMKRHQPPTPVERESLIPRRLLGTVDDLDSSDLESNSSDDDTD